MADPTEVRHAALEAAIHFSGDGDSVHDVVVFANIFEKYLNGPVPVVPPVVAQQAAPEPAPVTPSVAPEPVAVEAAVTPSEDPKV